MGVGAAFVMPATLSILTHVFENPAERAKAIAAWTAVSGLGVAIGPTAGGWLLEHFAWSSIFLVNIPVIAIALAGGRVLVPASAAPEAARLDIAGAALSVAALSTITWTLIEAPHYGWTSSTTLSAAALSATLLGAFIAWELHASEPMMELSLFRNARFTAASGSLTIVFFALFGCLFLLTQILQFVLGYGPLKAGLAALPFALVIGVTSPLAAEVAKRIGSKIPVTLGLTVMAAGFVTMATASVDSGYALYLLASVLIAGGMGFTMAPATESIMGALPLAKAGVGSAMNDTTREVGSVLGIAIIGSVVASAYTANLVEATAGLPSGARESAGESLGAAVGIAERIGGTGGAQLAAAAQEAFISAASGGLLIAAAVASLGALVAWRALPAHEHTTSLAADAEIGPMMALEDSR
jgi:EmrB/QacA subfamily drug resistance transporter